MATWTVPATVQRIKDADTIVVTCDLGFRISYTATVRLAGINAPELVTPEGIAARNHATSLLPVGTAVTLESHGLDKYGRVLGNIHMADGRDYATALTEAGHAQTYPPQ